MEGRAQTRPSVPTEYTRNEQRHRLVSTQDVAAVLQPGVHERLPRVVDENAEVRHTV